MKNITQPKYKIGDVVLVKSEKNTKVILQGIIKSAQCVVDWFYQIEARNPTSPFDEAEWIYTYEENTGDAKTEILTHNLNK